MDLNGWVPTNFVEWVNFVGSLGGIASITYVIVKFVRRTFANFLPTAWIGATVDQLDQLRRSVGLATSFLTNETGPQQFTAFIAKQILAQVSLLSTTILLCFLVSDRFAIQTTIIIGALMLSAHRATRFLAVADMVINPAYELEKRIVVLESMVQRAKKFPVAGLPELHEAMASVIDDFKDIAARFASERGYRVPHLLPDKIRMAIRSRERETTMSQDRSSNSP